MKNIAVFTSGGDSPGMNPCIRAVVRTALQHNVNIFGITGGYDGMIKGQITQLSHKDVAHIIHRGGTILKTSRSDAFRTKQGRAKAYAQLSKHNIKALIAIGGDGTFKGADLFSEEYDLSCIGLPGTIDNDLFGTDYTIGYDTALNTVIQAVDKIRDTAESHKRLFVVEVMGKDAGFIALRSAIASGAERVFVPEKKTDVDQLIDYYKHQRRADKTSGIIIVAEGDDSGGGKQIKQVLQEHLTSYDIKLTVLGHIQRGGSPSAFDRVHSSELGIGAVQRLLNAKQKITGMMGIVNRSLTITPFKQAIKHHKKINTKLVKTVELLAG